VTAQSAQIELGRRRFRRQWFDLHAGWSGVELNKTVSRLGRRSAAAPKLRPHVAAGAAAPSTSGSA